MNEEKKRPEEPKGKKAPFTVKNVFYHNTFVLAFSFVVAVVVWFIMSANSASRNVVIHDVPIQVNISSAAQEEGLQIFNMSYNTADVEVSGNNLLTSRLTADDFKVSVTLNPTSTKVAGNTLQKMTVQVRAVKTNSMGSYEIASVSPEEVTVEYDRSREVTFPIENHIQYSSADGYYAGTPVLSADNVTISGPESAVNRINHVAVSYNVENALRQDANFTCPIRLYDQNNQEITDTSGMYLTMNVDTIDVTIPVTPVKTVSLTASTLHQQRAFRKTVSRSPLRRSPLPGLLTCFRASVRSSWTPSSILPSWTSTAPMCLPVISPCPPGYGTSVLWEMQSARPRSPSTSTAMKKLLSPPVLPISNWSMPPQGHSCPPALCR